MKYKDYLQNRYRSEISNIKDTHRNRRKINSWLKLDTIDSWRHQRMYAYLDPILDVFHGDSWLTIGDGRYGTDAHYLLQKGARVTASNIDDALLKKAKKNGFIQKFRKENAERISCKDNSFDFILCKESLHHFPRPYTGLYEMLRVAKKGVVLIEPNDIFHNHTIGQCFFWTIKILFKKLVGIQEIPPYEPVGNYIFRVSEEEIVKVATSLDYSYVVTKGINDIYDAGVEYEKKGFSKQFIVIKVKIAILDVLCSMGLLKCNDIFIAIMKIKLSENIIKDLHSSGYKVIPLSKNPYIQ